MKSFGIFKVLVAAAFSAFCWFAIISINAGDFNDYVVYVVLTAEPTLEPTQEPTPAPTPDPTQDPSIKIRDYAPLEAQLAQRLSAEAGDWSLYYMDFTFGNEFAINSHQVYSASLIKLFVAEAVFDRINSGQIRYTEKLEEDIEQMISASDNEAWRSIAIKLGGGSYSEGMQIMTDTAAASGFADTGQFYKGNYKNFNFTSVTDCGLFLKGILNGNIISPEYSDKILGMMKNQEHRQKIPSGVPEGLVTANKTGELDYMQGDAAIIYAPSRTYILVIIGDDLDDSYETIPLFGELSEIVYNYSEGITQQPQPVNNENIPAEPAEQ